MGGIRKALWETTQHRLEKIFPNTPFESGVRALQAFMQSDEGQLGMYLAMLGCLACRRDELSLRLLEVLANRLRFPKRVHCVQAETAARWNSAVALEVSFSCGINFSPEACESFLSHRTRRPVGLLFFNAMVRALFQKAARGEKLSQAGATGTLSPLF